MIAITPKIEVTESDLQGGAFVDLSEESYRAAPGISQSMLKAFGEEPSPAHYMESLQRPKRVTEDMEFGTILHAAILHPHLLGEAYHLQPETYESTIKGKKGEPDSVIEKPWHGGADFCKAWKKDHADRPVIDSETAAKIPHIVKTVNELPVISDMLRTGQKEVSFFKRDPDTGLLLKARIDLMSTADDGTTYIADFKKVRRGYARPRYFGTIVADRGYDIQDSFYLEITGASKFIMVPMEDAAPFDADTYELDEGDRAEARLKWRALLDRFFEAQQSGQWPGYQRGVKRLKLPAWAKNKEEQPPEIIY